jgi:hypothetical protein
MEILANVLSHQVSNKSMYLGLALLSALLCDLLEAAFVTTGNDYS